jgi:hypothetical protein
MTPKVLLLALLCCIQCSNAQATTLKSGFLSGAPLSNQLVSAPSLYNLPVTNCGKCSLLAAAQKDGPVARIAPGHERSLMTGKPLRSRADSTQSTTVPFSDVALMLAFIPLLIAHQLRRKQKTLRGSSVSSS